MIDLLIWSLLTIGITYVITCSFIFAAPRMLIARISLFAKYFIYCAYCVSFWAGAASESIYSTDLPWTVEWFGSLVLMGFVAMGLVSVLKAAFPTLLETQFDVEQGGSGSDILVGEPVSSQDPDKKECPHRYTNVGSDKRCVLCGADAPEGHG